VGRSAVYASLLIYLLGALTAYVTFGGIAVESLAGLPLWAGALAGWQDAASCGEALSQ